jgi:hypothetical protein
MEITREIAEKVRDVVAAGLTQGVGEPVPGKMCVEAAVCYAMGQPHGDEPACVSPAVRRLKIGLNDRAWSSNGARAEGLRRLAIAQLGSADSVDDPEFIRRVADVTIRRAVPIGLRAAAKVNPAHAKALESAAVRCEQEGTREACEAARDAAANAAADAAYAAYAAANAAAAAAADAYAANAAANAAADAAYAANAAADAAYAAANARASARDKVLTDYAEWIVEILIDLKSPGCEFLDLVPKVA